MITELKEQMNIRYLRKVDLFHLDLKGIPFGMSCEELQFLADMIAVVLKERRQNGIKNKIRNFRKGS